MSDGLVRYVAILMTVETSSSRSVATTWSFLSALISFQPTSYLLLGNHPTYVSQKYTIYNQHTGLHTMYTYTMIASNPPPNIRVSHSYDDVSPTRQTGHLSQNSPLHASGLLDFIVIEARGRDCESGMRSLRLPLGLDLDFDYGEYERCLGRSTGWNILNGLIVRVYMILLSTSGPVGIL